MYCVLLRPDEFDFIREILKDVEAGLFVAEPWCPASMVVSLAEWTLEPKQVATFYGILRAVNRAARKGSDKRRKASYNR